MFNLSDFDFDDNGCNIRMTPDGRVSVFDVISVVLGKKNPRSDWSRLTTLYPRVLIFCHTFTFPGRGQHPTPVIHQEHLAKVLDLIPTVKSVKRNGRNSVTNDKFYPTTEAQIITTIEEAFFDCQPIRQFYVRGYRIDLYFPNHRIAVECDEYNHSTYCKKSEAKREQLIKESLGCSWVRFDPYCPDFSIGKVIYQIRRLIK